MRIVIALGGNALLRRGEALSADNQRENIRRAADVLAPLANDHSVIITHGNGPQVGLLALQGEACQPGESWPLDVLDAQTEGMIGYMIEQELSNRRTDNQRTATLLTQIIVDPADPAFQNPDKPIGPVYDAAEAATLTSERGWDLRPDGDHFRRVVPSPQPQDILELDVIKLLVDHGITVICAGGGGIPVVRHKDGNLTGVEAVIDKDRTSALLARALAADAFLMLTDVEAVFTEWNRPAARAIHQASPAMLASLSFAAGSMGPKVEAACDFVVRTGAEAGIGRLQDAALILEGKAGTIITRDLSEICYQDQVRSWSDGADLDP